ncbi:VIT1/CCC1 transporter family protein [candidate division WWE3 bacterium]|uniref:VIT1/CCC1 transporter family protein n=1 Tax=candidate division WWE3 bacterium TaxID=2053526 RepID=A0A955LKC2_UNCKA|nr:VIT1/CCC1 transporter family protein [candidate division WWE3 bacterium]
MSNDAITREQLEKHLENFHQRTRISPFLKEIVYGATDGIVTTFAVVAGFAGAQVGDVNLSIMLVLLFGFANLFADGLSMGLGNFLSLLTEREDFRLQQLREVDSFADNPEYELKETEFLLMEQGFTKGDAESLAQIYKKNPAYMLDFHMRYELEMDDIVIEENPASAALATFLAFISFGMIPLLPYVLLRGWENDFILSAVFTVFALVSLGVLRWRISHDNLLKSLFQVLVIGSGAAIVAFFVGTLFKI